MKDTLYDTLGVHPNATPEQLRRAFLLRIKLVHPDLFDPVRQRAKWDLANELLKGINHAYAVLRNPNTRAEYDLTISQKNAVNVPISTAHSGAQTSPPDAHDISWLTNKRLFWATVFCWLMVVIADSKERERRDTPPKTYDPHAVYKVTTYRNYRSGGKTVVGEPRIEHE